MLRGSWLFGVSLAVVCLALTLAACSADKETPLLVDVPKAEEPILEDAANEEPLNETSINESLADDPLDLPIGGEIQGNVLIDRVLESWLGDLDGMKERRIIRVLTDFSPTNYYIDHGAATGLTIDVASQFEKHLNKTLKGQHVSVVVLAAPIEQIFEWLVAGHGDIIGTNLTITPERAKLMSFSKPFASGVKEQVVLGPKAVVHVTSLDELAIAGIEVLVRPNSSYAEHLAELNNIRAASGLKQIRVAQADPRLHDEDILDLVASGMAEATVMDDYLLDLWLKVYDNLKAPEGVVISDSSQIAWAVRPESPELLKAINSFVPKMRKGTLHGNMLIKKYLGDRTRAVNALDDTGLRRLEGMIEILQRNGDAYGFDWLLLAAQGFQESRLDQSARSHRGAVGVMQLLPSTAKEPYINISDIGKLESNIEAGAKYNRWLMDNFFDDPEISQPDRILFALASYNAGPGNLKKARKRAAKMKLDPNRWFDNVEIAMAKSVSREPVIYVRNIYKYYTAYRLYVAAKEIQQEVEP